MAARLKRIAPAALALLALLLGPSARAALTIEITEGVEGALPIAVVPFAWEGSGPAPADIAEIVSADLHRSGRFKPTPRSALAGRRPHEGREVDFQAWRAEGVESLVVGKVRPRGPGAFAVQFQLFDVPRGKQLAGYSIPATSEQLRAVAHQISDIVYERLIGEPGAFNTHIAYVTAQPEQTAGKRYHLMVADSDGHDPRTVVSSEEPLMSPAWSPDGERLAYVSFEVGRPQVFVQRLRTGERRKVAAFEGINGAPAWSPDGRRLALTLSRDGDPEIYLLEVASGNLRRLTRSTAIDTEPVWNPDGQSIVFTSDRGGSPQLYRMPVLGGRPERLTFEGGYNARAAFSPDGRELAMVHGQGGQYRIAVMELETGLLRVLTDGRLDESPSFAPNGSMVLYASAAGQRGVLRVVSVDGRVRQRLAAEEGDVREPAWSPFRQ